MSMGSVIQQTEEVLLHQPVMLAESMRALAIKPNGVYVDCTYGRGGHSQEILQRLNHAGRLIAIDKDLSAVKYAEEQIHDDRFTIQHASYADIQAVVDQLQITGGVDGILLDLGVSSPQLDDPVRGFSFLRDGPLDMRMDQSQGMTAREWLAICNEQELVKVLFDFGEERYARRIARAILRERELNPITTTKHLAEIIASANPNHEPGKHPATRSFQGIRIHINNELQDVMVCLEQTLELLKIGGRLVVISFHSLEDRIVKRFFRKHARGDEYPIDLPITADLVKPRLEIVDRALRPSTEEVRMNPRARSATLRVVEKLG